MNGAHPVTTYRAACRCHWRTEKERAPGGRPHHENDRDEGHACAAAVSGCERRSGAAAIPARGRATDPNRHALHPDVELRAVARGRTPGGPPRGRLALVARRLAA